MKFIKIKKFLFENKDIYENESYFPNKVFNIDSFPIALSINLSIFNLFHLIFPKKESCCSMEEYCFDCFEDWRRDYIFIYYLYMIPLFIANIIAVIFDFINTTKVNEAYD